MKPQPPAGPRVLNIVSAFASGQGTAPGTSLNYRAFDIIFAPLGPICATLTNNYQNSSQHGAAAVVAELDKLKEYVDTGRVLVIWPAPKDAIFRGGGDPWSNIISKLNELPLPVEVVPSMGNNITPTTAELKPFFSAIENGLNYRFRFDPGRHIPLANTDANNPRCVSSGFVTEKNGVILCLPEINTGLGQTTIDTVLGLADYLRANYGSQRVPLPAWASALTTPQEAPLKKAIADVEAQLAGLGDKLTITQKQLSGVEARKQLFAGQGNALRDQVAWAFRTLGFSVTVHDSNRVDVTAEYGGQPFVMEVKGSRKSAGEDDVAQLMKWDLEYVEKHHKMPICILVMNAYSDVPLSTRLTSTECRPFPANVIELATKRNFRLVTGVQLFNMAHAVEANPACGLEIAKLFLSGPTEIPRFTDMPAFVAA